MATPALETLNARPDGDQIRQELKYLRSITRDIPYILEQPTDSKPKEFSFPLGTVFKAPSREIGLDMKRMYARGLREHGIAGIELGFEDPHSQFILELVEAMGCNPDTHSSTQGALVRRKHPMNPRLVSLNCLFAL